MNVPPVVVKNPNAVAALVSSLGGGQIIVNVCQHLFGWSISTGWGIAIAGGLAGALLFFWDHGLLGVWNRIKNGKAV